MREALRALADGADPREVAADAAAREVRRRLVGLLGLPEDAVKPGVIDAEYTVVAGGGGKPP